MTAGVWRPGQVLSAKKARHVADVGDTLRAPPRAITRRGSDSGSVVVAVEGAKKQVVIILRIWAQ